MHICNACDYKTVRKDSFVRHQNSKKHIHNVLINTHHKPPNIATISENVVPKSENVVSESENVVPKSENVSHICRKCNKTYRKKEYLLNHEKTCSGINVLTCPRCMKTFADRHIKSKHCKRNNCKPVSIFEVENVKSIINNTNNTNITSEYQTITSWSSI